MIPDRMRAAVYKGNQTIEVEDYPIPTVGTHDVLLEISHCGVCGSDIHFVLEGWSAPNRVHGHEFSGTVVAVGEAVTRWVVGDSVVGGPSERCGECQYCRAGRPNLCNGRAAVGVGGEWQGAFADYMRVPERELLRLPPGLSLREAALTEPLAVALHGLTRAEVQPGERVLITGGGPIGALSAAALIHRGVTDVVVSEPSPVRRELCARLGATVVEPEALVTPPMPDAIVEESFHVALECSGHAVAMEQCLGQLARMGRLVLVGAGVKPPRFDPNRILLNELSITGAFCYDDGGFDAALAMLAARDFPTDVLIEPDDVGLSELRDAIGRLGSGEVPAKVVVAPARGR
ncbi:MAG: alcohol dehydrogenase catalytic domain-containing protein [Acidimicrobiia bacterium]|nr:alcohol dehydrogenase catalytic domain-containing protein [Acidimicrobiia bacterium]